MFNSISFCLFSLWLVFIVSENVCVDSESHTLTPSIEVPQLCDKFSASHLLGTASLTCYIRTDPALDEIVKNFHSYSGLRWFLWCQAPT